MERENEDLHEVMIYTRAITSFAVITIFLQNVWHTLLTTLGISTAIYDKDRLEKETLQKQEENRKKSMWKIKESVWNNYR